MPSKPPYRPLTGVELLPSEEERPTVAVSFRMPVRRIRRGDFDCRFEMTLAEATYLHSRLGRTLEQYRKAELEAAAAKKAADRG
ncbi:hypothetical protein [Methylorubrum populi]|uniref:hypothetical protein n=1 Tax=Methylorubrum populi TaxID=223967 RepID=UPI003F65CDD6